MLSKLFIAATVLAAGVNAAQVDVDDYDDMAMQVRLMSNHTTPFTAVTTMTFSSVNSSTVVQTALRATGSNFNSTFITALNTAINNQAATVTLTAQVSVSGRRQLEEESAEERELQTTKTLTQPWSAAGLDATAAAAAKTAVEGTTASAAIATAMGSAIGTLIGETVTVTVTTAATVGGPAGGGSPAAPTPATSFAAGKSIAFGLYAVMMALVAMMMA